MIEIEVYAKGLRAESAQIELRAQMDLLPDIRYKVDTYHDLVYFEIDAPQSVSLRRLNDIFTCIGLEPRIVGQVPEGLAREGDTHRIELP